jgi:hypothetical protein
MHLITRGGVRLAPQVIELVTPLELGAVRAPVAVLETS